MGMQSSFLRALLRMGALGAGSSEMQTIDRGGEFGFRGMECAQQQPGKRVSSAGIDHAASCLY